MDAKERKEHIKWNIAQNPVEIIIQRTEKIRQGGGFKDEKSTVGPMTVRIYVDSAQTRSGISSDTIGRKEVSGAYALLADDEADIQAGPDIIDEFEVITYGKFIVKTVHPQIVKGIVCGYQADIERVK